MPPAATDEATGLWALQGTAGNRAVADLVAGAHAGGDPVAVQRLPVLDLVKPSYWAGRRVSKHAGAYQAEIDAETDTEKLLRSSSGGALDDARAYVRKLLSAKIGAVIKASKRILAGHDTALKKGDDDFQGSLEGTVDDLLAALVPMVFPADGGYVKGELLDLIREICASAGGHQWTKGSTRRAQEALAIDVLFLRALAPAIFNLTQDYPAGSLGRDAAIHTSACLQWLANGAPKGKDQQAWRQGLAAPYRGARDAFLATVMQKVGAVAPDPQAAPQRLRHIPPNKPLPQRPRHTPPNKPLPAPPG
ncbi:MAG TPA: hypothetical protein VHX88_22175 [Solirubrobacteraceae bacterium]|nr:hypothetical protein [Solirubrobacteraceae bacterium]